MMLRLNVIMLVDETGDRLLMCKRRKDPYKGLYNFVGGKAKPGEAGLHAAYRELREETGVSAADVTLRHLATLCYHNGGAGLPPYELQAYVGRLRHGVQVAGEENPLEWQPMAQNFFDMYRFAGEGSVGHIVESVRRYHPQWLEAAPLQLTLSPLLADDLPILAYELGQPLEMLRPMLAASDLQCHEGRWFRQYAIRLEDCTVGTCSLYAQSDCAVLEGVDIFPTFRRCGLAAQTVTKLMDIARQQGYAVMTTQVRTDNTPSLALHRKLGFTASEPWINAKGREVVNFRKTL